MGLLSLQVMVVMVGNGGYFYGFFFFFWEVACDCDSGCCGWWCWSTVMGFVVGC